MTAAPGNTACLMATTFRRQGQDADLRRALYAGLGNDETVLMMTDAADRSGPVARRMDGGWLVRTCEQLPGGVAAVAYVRLAQGDFETLEREAAEHGGFTKVIAGASGVSMLHYERGRLHNLDGLPATASVGADGTARFRFSHAGILAREEADIGAGPSRPGL